MLTLVVPKREEAKPKQIKVSVGDDVDVSRSCCLISWPTEFAPCGLARSGRIHETASEE